MKLGKLGKAAGGILKAIVPTLATAVGSPVLGGLASSVLEAAFPGDSKAEIEKKIAEGSPETLLALRKAEQDLEIRMEELGLEREALYVGDVQDSREHVDRTGVAPHITLTILFVGGYFLIFLAVLSGYMKPAEGLKDMALILLGVLAGEVPRIMAWWFGSTKGSADKNKYMASIAELRNGK